MKIGFGIFSILFLTAIFVGAGLFATLANINAQFGRNSTPNSLTPLNENPTSTVLDSPFPTEVIHHGPPEQHIGVTVDLASAKGFSRVDFEDVNRQIDTLFVLAPGKTATVSINVNSSSNKNLEVSLSTDFAGETPQTFHGVQYNFSPQTFVLTPGGQQRTTLTLKAEQNAPTGLYETSIMASTEEGGIGVGGPTVLVSNSVPNYYYQIAGMLPNGPVSYQNGSFVPTVHLAPPTFEIPAGGKIEVMFDLTDFQGDKSLNITEPPGFQSQVLLHPFDTEPRPTMDNLYLITVSPNSTVTKGTYELTVKATAGNSFTARNVTFERSFYVTVG